MAIRFACPACRQPLEIDEAWSGQSVACPYCQHVVTAPQTSTWPSGDVPLASAARPEGGPAASSGFAPPPPPPGTGRHPAYTPPRTGSAGWALTLTLIGAVAIIGLTLAWYALMVRLATENAGPGASMEKIQQALADLLSKGQFPRFPGLAMIAVAAILASVGGVALAVRSLARQEPGRGMAIAACVIGALFLLCQVMLMMVLLGPRPPA